MELNNIKYAPRDGEHILGYGTHCVDGFESVTGIMEVYYDTEDGEWANIANCPSEVTHWAPMPTTRLTKS